MKFTTIFLSLIAATTQAKHIHIRYMGGNAMDLEHHCNKKTHDADRHEIRQRCGIAHDDDVRDKGVYRRGPMECVMQETIQLQEDQCLRAMLDFFKFKVYNNEH